MRKALLLLAVATTALAVSASALAAGETPLPPLDTTYGQDFDTLASTGTSSVVPPGWAFSESGTNANTTYNTGSGTNNAGDTYSFGATASTERALGGLLSGSLTPLFGAGFVNNGTSIVTSVDLDYAGEQWRLGTADRGPDRIDFQYSTSATGLTDGVWTDVNDLDFSSRDTALPLGARDGNASANRTTLIATVNGLSIMPGQTVWIRWTDFNAGGADDGLAVDDFHLTPHGTAAGTPILSIADATVAEGNSGTTTASFAITLNQPAGANGVTFDVATADDSATAASGDYDARSTSLTIPAGESSATFAVTVNGDTTFEPDETFKVAVTNIAGADAGDANAVGTITNDDEPPVTRISEVQGSGATSPKAGQQVTVEGVVVGDYQLTPSQFGGFYLEEEDADQDSDPATSEGVFVFGGGVDVHTGDVVRVRGTVTEFNGLTELGSVTSVSVVATGASVTPAPVSLPVANVDDLERYEGMLVSFSQTLTATEVFNLGRFGEVSLSGAGRLFTGTAVAPPGAAANAVTAQNNRSRIILDDANNQQNIDPTVYPLGGLSATNTLRVGDSLNGLTGVMDFRFSAYRIQPIGPLSFIATNPRSDTPPAVGGNLRIASFNVLNYFNGDGLGGGFPTARGANTPFEFGRQRAKEIAALSAMNADVVGLMELENDAQPNSAIADLVNGLNDAMGAGTYAFIDTGIIGTDEIKVGLLYKPAAVTPVGDWKIITSAVDPRFDTTRNRPSLAQTFQQNATGRKLTVVVNHLKSKGSACDPDDPDTGDGSGNCNLTRTRAAAALVDWLKTDPTGSGDPDFLLIGDMNSYAFESPITTFEAGGFTNLVRREHGLSAYSYVFNGESGYLDHALATSSLAAQVVGVNDWHINPDEPTVLDYNTEFKTANQVDSFYAPTPFRSSDHDPVVIGVQLAAKPSANAGGPYTVAEGGSVALDGTGSTGSGLTYAWDLDDNGTFETTGATPTFSAAALDGPLTRTVSLKVSDGELSDVATTTVGVTNVAPTATFVAPATTFAGFPFTLRLTNPTDPAPADTFAYAFDCGDGVGYGSFGAASTASCPTSAVGTRTVRGKIRDDDGGVTEYTATVQVVVTPQSLCDLTLQYVRGSAKYQALPPAARAAIDKLATALCDKLATLPPNASPAATAAVVLAYRAGITGLEQAGWLTPAQAATLRSLAGSL